MQKPPGGNPAVFFTSPPAPSPKGEGKIMQMIIFGVGDEVKPYLNHVPQILFPAIRHFDSHEFRPVQLQPERAA